MIHYDTIIVGAGAAGLFCASLAAKRGRKVLVLEKSNKVGKKILMSGGGRCNFTNYYIEPDRYLSHNPHFCKSALSRFTQWHFIELVDRYQISWHEKEAGQLFCDRTAKDILAMLLSECEQGSVEIETNVAVTGVEKSSCFEVLTEKGVYKADTVVVSSGGLSIPTLGGSGVGYEIAQHWQLSCQPLRAGLVPFTISDQFKAVCETLSGVSLLANVSVPDRGFQNQLLFTHRGISGPAVLQLSNYWQPGQSISIDFLPNDELLPFLKVNRDSGQKNKVRNLLSQFFPNRFVEQFFKDQEAVLQGSIAEMSNRKMEQLADQVHHFSLKPSGTEGYRTAEVTLGGVDTQHLSSKSMEVSQVPGLFFIGEVVDVTGHLGGFNFQWAWSSAYAAAEHL